MVNIADIKVYLRIDHDFDDALLSALIEVARAEVNGSIEVKDPEDPRFNHAVFLLVGHYYDNRSATAQASTELPFGVTSLIQQLRGLRNE